MVINTSMKNGKSFAQRSFRKQYLNLLQNYLHKLSRNQRNNICKAIEHLADKSVEEHKALVIDIASRTHLEMTALVLASYQTLLPYNEDSTSLIGTLKDVFSGVGQRWIQLYTRVLLWISRDPFTTMINVSKKRVQNNYGITFKFEYSGDGINEYIITTKKCFYHDFFVINGIPGLTCVFCYGDKNWFEGIKPEKHGFKF